MKILVVFCVSAIFVCGYSAIPPDNLVCTAGYTSFKDKCNNCICKERNPGEPVPPFLCTRMLCGDYI
ncbi:hypothetical protein GE061_010164 [Apolygus lucorum]|uniref:Pacifastin domain-containing protein n=1 Tax=Apolygus lucorum TaxID=248454 RepID=A0A6A4KJT2_APOLU|nr:hypothetical protein GE061_010164 [Apolygus lucorum]